MCAKQHTGLVRPELEYGCSVWDPHTQELQVELGKVENHARTFVIGNFIFETVIMTSMLGRQKGESLKK